MKIKSSQPQRIKSLAQVFKDIFFVEAEWNMVEGE